MKIFEAIVSIICLGFIIGSTFIFGFDTCNKDLIESIQSPNGEYLLKIDNNKIYLINSNKMSELNRTDYKYMKRILTSNELYNFS